MWTWESVDPEARTDSTSPGFEPWARSSPERSGWRSTSRSRLVGQGNRNVPFVPTSGMLSLPQPYLLFLGDTKEPSYARTAFGLRDWAGEACVGEMVCEVGRAHV